MEVRTPAAVAPGGDRALPHRVDARIPHGDVGRAGWVHDYHFIVQWFPKIGVLLEGRLERATSSTPGPSSSRTSASTTCA